MPAATTPSFAMSLTVRFPLLQNPALKLALLLLPAAATAASPSWLTAHDAEIQQLVGKMTLAEKAGQMTQPDLGSHQGFRRRQDPLPRLRPQRRRLGSEKRQHPRRLVRHLSRTARGARLKTRLAIPLLYGVDAVHGHNNVLGAVDFPPQHRPRLHAQSGTGRTGRAHHRPGSPRHRHPVGLRPVRDRPAGHPLGPHLRGVFGRSRPGRQPGSRRRARLAGRRPGSHDRRRSAARNISSATAAPPTAPPARTAGSTRATPAWTRPPCAPSTWRAIPPRSTRAWPPSCRPTAVGTA